MKTSTLPTMLQRFFTDRLSAQLQASPNTIAGYRDTFRLLLRFASERRQRPPTKLLIEDVDSDLIGDFLTHVETVRRNSARSRDPLVLSVRGYERTRARAALSTDTHYAEQALRAPNGELSRSYGDGSTAVGTRSIDVGRPP